MHDFWDGQNYSSNKRIIFLQIPKGGRPQEDFGDGPLVFRKKRSNIEELASRLLIRDR